MLAVIGIAAAAVDAGPITTYDINFVPVSGTAPISGSFGWNGTTFTDFTVDWLGVTFDLTSSANAPNVGGSCTSSAATTFEFLSTGKCGAVTLTTLAWEGIENTTGPTQVFDLNGIDGSSDSVVILADGPGPVDTNQSAIGTFSITAVPEPNSAVMILIGVAVLGFFWRQGRKTPAAR